MDQYTYYFNQANTNKTFYSLLNSSLFQQIIDFFIEHENERIILRQLKKSIKTDENLELFLDKMIQFKLISRLERHYYLAFPIYDLADYPLSFSEDLLTILASIHQQENDHLTGFVGEILWQSCETKEDYFFGVKKNPTTPSFYEKKIVGDNELKMVAIQESEGNGLTIPTYFELLSLNKLPKQYNQLEKLLGDVNQEYFFTQVKKLLKKAQKNRNSSTKRDIFEEALLLTNNLVSKDGKLLLAKPIIESDVLETNDSNHQQLIKLLNEMWQLYESVNEQTLIKKMTYSKMMELFLGEKEVLSYFLT
ncbi:DUF1803 domain-containing protein [Enterococcus sp. LJL99]